VFGHSIALITGRYQYRLRLGWEEPLAGNPDVGLPEHPTCLAVEEGWLQLTLAANGIWAFCRSFGPLKSGYDHFTDSRRSGGLLSHAFGRDKEDLWDDDVPIHKAGT